MESPCFLSNFVPHFSTMKIDLRSDTVTRPTPGMLDAMFKAEVGDDVFSEDPTINTLEERAAKMFGKEAGLFCPSGTMTNQIAINVLTKPGDEVVCDYTSHIYQYEGGGIARNSGVQAKLLTGDRGRISATQVEESINQIFDWLT
ncbi:MAG: low-specificity L-threonine aldolase, partial [Bacteroidota bacterium]